MAQHYSVEFENVSVSAAQDFFELSPADDRPVEIVGWVFTQISDVGDTEEEILRVKVLRGHTTSGSGGSTSTPAPLHPRSAAAGFTCEVNNTTEASVGTTVDLYSGGFNVRVGDLFLLPPELALGADQGNTTIVLRLMAAPADAITLSGTLFVKEG